VGAEIPTEGKTIVTVTEKGFGKRTGVEEYRLQSRGGKGTINLKTVPRVGLVSGICQVVGDEDIILISNAGKIIRVRVEEVPLIHRSTQGVRLIDLDDSEQLVGLARVEREADNGSADSVDEEPFPEEEDGGEDDA
jgi:DNA gyrase subunit A